jgi:hypothetical protein
VWRQRAASPFSFLFFLPASSHFNLPKQELPEGGLFSLVEYFFAELF